jgi:hypothetical protein
MKLHIGPSWDEIDARNNLAKEPTVGKTDEEIRETIRKQMSLYDGMYRDRILLELLLEIRAALERMTK